MSTSQEKVLGSRSEDGPWRTWRCQNPIPKYASKAGNDCGRYSRTLIGGSEATKESRDSDGPTGGSEIPVGGHTTPAVLHLRFRATLLAIGFSGLLGALEATITSTALPTVTAELGGGDLYIRAINSYFLAM
ncbi:Major Facilitator Superfamily protein [Metarhizium acridum CQMa 102]|uniref:Major Facilitator Superfamily protein n=1 Tax=Metarhizium acridum (strain CQMa 102) TaxID=655827 RepID=E9DWP4_METAQ|nr:Major Facilitator Superfamily protein [Metarhizium acridum CQMa 102]EFY91757.1 Major Facilitator Superfamily protein [Metarhizium acridum CQMa 102]